VPVEWSLAGPTPEGNPFDLVPAVTIGHANSGENTAGGVPTGLAPVER